MKNNKNMKQLFRIRGAPAALLPARACSCRRLRRTGRCRRSAAGQIPTTLRRMSKGAPFTRFRTRPAKAFDTSMRCSRFIPSFSFCISRLTRKNKSKESPLHFRDILSIAYIISSYILIFNVKIIAKTAILANFSHICLPRRRQKKGKKFNKYSKQQIYVFFTIRTKGVSFPYWYALLHILHP